MPPGLAGKIDTVVDLARTHLSEARRSVGTLRPNVGDGEEVAAALKRLAGVAQRTTDVPIDVKVDELPRLGDLVEREIIGIAQEALSNAVRHSRAQRITFSAATVRSIGVRLSVADDGRGIAHGHASGGFGHDQHAGTCGTHRRLVDDRHGAAQRNRSRARLGAIEPSDAGARCRLKRSS
jgi:signal transduction histidine kinase